MISHWLHQQAVSQKDTRLYWIFLLVMLLWTFNFGPVVGWIVAWKQQWLLLAIFSARVRQKLRHFASLAFSIMKVLQHDFVHANSKVVHWCPHRSNRSNCYGILFLFMRWYEPLLYQIYEKINSEIARYAPMPSGAIRLASSRSTNNRRRAAACFEQIFTPCYGSTRFGQSVANAEDGWHWSCRWRYIPIRSKQFSIRPQTNKKVFRSQPECFYSSTFTLSLWIINERMRDNIKTIVDVIRNTSNFARPPLAQLLPTTNV